MSNRNDPSFGSPTLPIKPDIRDYPLRPEPRLEDFPFIPVPEPHEDKIQVIFSDLSPEDYPLWLQPRGWKKWAVSLLAALPFAAVIIVILAVRASASFKDLFVGPVFELFAVLFFAAWLLILFLQWLLKPLAAKAAEKKAASRIYQAHRLQWQEETQRRKAEQERLYQQDKTRWLKEKEQRNRNYQEALRAWEKRCDDLIREYEQTTEALTIEMDHMIDSRLVDEVADWIMMLFMESFQSFQPGNTRPDVGLECLIHVEAERIVCIPYDMLEADKELSLKHIVFKLTRDKRIYDFHEKRRSNLISGISRTAMLIALTVKMNTKLLSYRPEWAGKVQVFQPDRQDYIKLALNGREYVEDRLRYTAKNKTYVEIQAF